MNSDTSVKHRMIHRSRTIIRTVLCFSAITLPARCISGQSSLDQYDTTTRITVNGVLFGMATLESPRPVYLLVENRDSSGTIRWAIEAKPIAELRKVGWTPETLKGGETITVRVYRAKRNALVAETIPTPRRRALETVYELAKEGRLFHGIDLTLPDGKTLPL